MDNKSSLGGSIVAIIVGGIVIFGMGYLVFELVLNDFFAANRGAAAAGVQLAQPLYWAVGVGCLLQAALVCYALGGRSGAGAGAKVGAIVGLLLWGAADFMMYAFTSLSNLTATIADPLASAVTTAVGGAAIGFVLGKMKSA